MHSNEHTMLESILLAKSLHRIQSPSTESVLTIQAMVS